MKERDEIFAKHEARMRADYERGDRRALTKFICMCMVADRAVPRWAAGEFYRAVLKVNRLEASWDEVFGPTPPKGKRLDATRRKLAAVNPIMRLVHQHFEAGRGLSKKLFNEIGAEVGFSGTDLCSATDLVRQALLRDLRARGALPTSEITRQHAA
jgi:hypothetical protein